MRFHEVSKQNSLLLNTVTWVVLRVLGLKINKCPVCTPKKTALPFVLLFSCIRVVALRRIRVSALRIKH